MEVRKNTFSVVCTLRNERASVPCLLDSLLEQTVLASEIVVVDGGSTDGTVEILNKYAMNNKRIRVIESKSNISRGRNIGISASKNKKILLIDGGCKAKPDWCEKMIAAFKDNSVDVVGGFYTMTGSSNLQIAVKPFIGIPASDFNEKNFRPSARSMGIRKNVWEKIGGFPEHMKYAEDTVFNYKLLKNKLKITIQKRAVVEWTVPDTLHEIINKFFNYAYGDAQSKIYWDSVKKLNTHTIRILMIYARYLFFIFMLFFNIKIGLLLIFCQFFYVLLKVIDAETNLSWIFSPFLKIIVDLSVMVGFVVGLTKKYELS